jgi:UDP-glucose 4-epimerase
MKKILVTGGAGFIGSNLVKKLAAKGHRIRVFDNLTTGHKRNLENVSGKIDFVKGDLRNAKAVQKAAKGIDFVFHLGAIRAVNRSVEDPSETNDVNVTGMLNLLMAAKSEGVKRVVYASSSSVYGEVKTFSIAENEPLAPESPYAAAKIMGEYYCQIFYKLYGLETVALRFFNVFGPNQNPESTYSMLIPIFIQRLLEGRSPEVHWDGKQSRDFVYVDDIVKAMMLAMHRKGVAGQVFNIGSEENHSVIEVFNLLKKMLKTPHIKPTFYPKRAGDVRRTLADTSKARKMLGFKASYSFEDGIKKTLDWFISSGVLARLSKS